MTASNPIPFFKSAELFVEINSDSSVVRALDSALLLESSERKHRGKRCDIQVWALFPKRGADRAILKIQFSSRDLVSLRASLNSNLRLVASALKTLRAVTSLENTKATSES